MEELHIVFCEFLIRYIIKADEGKWRSKNEAISVFGMPY